MQILVLMVTSMIAVSLAGPFKEAKLEHVLEELEVVLQDLKEDNVQAEEFGRTSNDELEEVLRKMDEPRTNMFTPAVEEMLLHTADIEAATAEIKAAGGHVAIQLGRDLLIAQVPSNFISNQNNFASASAHIANSASPETLSNTKAYWKYREDKLQPQPKVQKWTESDIEETCTAHMALSLTQSDDDSSPYRQTMTGKIAVRVFVVSGPGELAISDSELETPKTQVMKGLKFWTDEADVANVELMFALSFEKVDIETPVKYNKTNNNPCPSQKDCLDVILGPTLQQLTCSNDQSADIKCLAERYKDDESADGAFLAFITKYDLLPGLRRDAYVGQYGSGPVFMEYGQGAWRGPLFAHEVGHVFNAPDEYGNCKCSAKHGKGTCTAMNENCINCENISQVQCVMAENVFKVCEYTKKHIGWC